MERLLEQTVVIENPAISEKLEDPIRTLERGTFLIANRLAHQATEAGIALEILVLRFPEYNGGPTQLGRLIVIRVDDLTPRRFRAHSTSDAANQ
jgi:hypothetical protein